MNKKQTVAALEADGYSVRPYPWTPAPPRPPGLVRTPRGRHGRKLTRARLILNGPILSRTPAGAAPDRYGAGTGKGRGSLSRASGCASTNWRVGPPFSCPASPSGRLVRRPRCS